ncbi:hypothetical protein O9929_02910 [Vibrio lentus]|nr:hypothetical protein [Vibrio lentus]
MQRAPSPAASPDKNRLLWLIIEAIHFAIAGKVTQLFHRKSRASSEHAADALLMCGKELKCPDSSRTGHQFTAQSTGQIIFYRIVQTIPKQGYLFDVDDSAERRTNSRRVSLNLNLKLLSLSPKRKPSH